MFVFIYCLQIRIIVDIMTEKPAMPFWHLQHAFLIFNGLIFQFQNQAIQFFGRKIIFHNFSPYKIRFSLQHVNAITMQCEAKKKEKKSKQWILLVFITAGHRTLDEERKKKTVGKNKVISRCPLCRTIQCTRTRTFVILAITLRSFCRLASRKKKITTFGRIV